LYVSSQSPKLAFDSFVSRMPGGGIGFCIVAALLAARSRNLCGPTAGTRNQIAGKAFVRLPALVQALTESLRPFYTNHSLFSVTAWGVRHIRALGEFHFGRPSSYQGYMVCHSIGFEKSSGHSCDTSFFNRVDMPRPCTHGGYGQYSCSRPNINNHITRFYYVTNAGQITCRTSPVIQHGSVEEDGIFNEFHERPPAPLNELILRRCGIC